MRCASFLIASLLPGDLAYVILGGLSPTAGLSGVVAFEPDDLTLTVRGGTPLERIHDLLV